MFGGLFFKFLTLSSLGGGGGHNFLNYHPFLTIFNALNTLVGGIQVLFEHQKQRSPPLPLDPACP